MEIKENVFCSECRHFKPNYYDEKECFHTSCFIDTLEKRLGKRDDGHRIKNRYNTCETFSRKVVKIGVTKAFIHNIVEHIKHGFKLCTIKYIFILFIISMSFLLFRLFINQSSPIGQY